MPVRCLITLSPDSLSPSPNITMLLLPHLIPTASPRPCAVSGKPSLAPRRRRSHGSPLLNRAPLHSRRRQPNARIISRSPFVHHVLTRNQPHASSTLPFPLAGLPHPFCSLLLDLRYEVLEIHFGGRGCRVVHWSPGVGVLGEGRGAILE